MNFIDALKAVYFADPCGVLSIPLWKVLPGLDEEETCMLLDADGRPEHLEAWTADSLLIYWDARREWRPAAPPELVHQSNLAVVHSRYASRLTLSSNTSVQRFFRLALGQVPPPHFELPDRFTFKPVELPTETALVAEVIGRSYAHLRPTQGEVIGWMQDPVFAPDLWVWITDQRTGLPAGLGIAELDRDLGEASLEWIQVVPEYRGQGLAKALVSHLLGQIGPRARLVTVSGEADNPSDAEHLYRRCGFAGSDVWWVVRRLGT